MILGKKQKMKAGVSLVTVLLFMLVATIAATATYKWLSSEGFSSASRMMKREAYQSSVAGIENARAWMTFHANETGALIKQYIYDNDGNPKTTKTPINMDQQIQSFAQGGRQDHHVWLVGVNTEGQTYKVKILSEGRSRNGQARHSEVAIFNVDGLYQVQKPTKTEEFESTIDFKFNYFGGSTTTGGTLAAYSILVNGNLLGANPVYSETDLIVTGDVVMSASGIGADGTTCIGGNLEANNGVYGSDFYIGGNASNFSWPTCPEGWNTYQNPSVNQTSCPNPTAFRSVTGNVYINGNLNPADKGDGADGGQKFPQNLTLNGTWYTNYPAKKSAVVGDLCLGEHGKILMNQNPPDAKKFTVGGNVWMPGDTSLWVGSEQRTGCTCEEYNCTCTLHTYLGGGERPCNEVPSYWIKTKTCTPTGATISCSDGSEHLISCSTTNLLNGTDNYDHYDRIILGENSNSIVYMKSGRSYSDYEELYNSKKFTTEATQVRNCKSGDCYGPTNRQNWNHETLETYMPIESKEGLHYVYLGLLNNAIDVGYGAYYDDWWNRDIHGFFVNFTESTKDTTTRFTDSHEAYNTCSDKRYQPNLNSNKCYRYLNYEGGKIIGSPYCYAKTTAKKYVPRCGVYPWFKSNSTSFSSTILSPQPFTCAENVKTTCMAKLGSKTTGCDGSSYKINDLLKTAYSSFVSYANLGCNVTAWSDDVSDRLNTCYSTNNSDSETAKTNLYKGYQVVEISSLTKKDPFTPLEGHFIIIITQSSGEAITLPPTTDTSTVLVYLPNGYNGDIQPGCPKDKRDEGKCSGSTYNYFIYTAGNINQVLFNTDVFSGSVYAEVGANTCANVGKFQARKMEYNEKLLEHLEEHGVLCKNDGSPCGSTTGGEGGESGGGSGSTGTDGYEVGGLDPFYISNAPQLGVTLESQYETSESTPVLAGDNSNALTPSFIVLPRVIYLNTDPYGKLSDYFNVISLNGANVTKASANVTCSPQLNVNTSLVSGDTKLTEGIYECNAAPSGFKKVPFWVWVQGSQHSTPTISFVEESKSLSPGQDYDVKINLPPHATEITVKVTCPDAPASWSTWTIGSGGSQSGSECTFTFPADAGEHTQPVLFTVHTPAEAANGSIVFTLQPPESGAGYKLGAPWTTSLVMSSTATLTNIGNVSTSEINTWCASNSGCPAEDLRNDWPDCPNKTTKEWVVPDWSSPGFSTPNPNVEWSVVTKASGDPLKLIEKTSPVSGCIVIIPEENNSQPTPIEAGKSYTLRAIAKARSNSIRLQFVGDVDGLNPFVSISAGDRHPPCSYNDKDDHSCIIPVFDGENLEISIDKTDTQNEGFSYWKCENNGGSTCPTTDPISSVTFSDDEDDFKVKDNNAVIYIHFGEQDKHCFFDEFRRGNITCGTETEYCIDFCDGTCGSATSTGNYSKSKWKLVRGSSDNIETSSYPGYVVAAKRTPNTGVLVMSSVQAGIRGTLRSLFQLPHATSSYDKDSPKIKNSGFLLRSNAAGTQFLMLNVYENKNGHLEAQVCLDGGTGGNCRTAEFMRGSSKASVSASSMVMLAATLEGVNTLKLKAWTDGYYYNSGDISSQAYATEDFDLSSLGNNHASMAYEYVGFSLAHRDFKIYGIGWESDDYASECFDGPPTVKCSFAAVATNGMIPTNGSGEGQSTAYQKPWVGHSGWFDSQDCEATYSYVGGTDANTDERNGYKFNQSGAGAHGYKNGEDDVKTAYAGLSCNATSTETRAWAAVEPAHCGPFWTGKYSECKNDIANLLDVAITLPSMGSPEGPSFTSAKNLRGLTSLDFIIANESESEVDLEVWLESRSNEWGSSTYSSRHERITGNASSFTQGFDVISAFGDNATGFDPEHVVGIKFRNNGNALVTVNAIAAPCKNMVKFSGCSVERVGETGWNVTLTVPENADKLSQINLRATVGGANYSLPNNGTYDFGGNLTLNVPDLGMFSNAGNTYVFSAQVYSETNEYTSDWKTCTCETCNIGAITCKNASLTTSEIEIGDASPRFHFEIDGCPAKGCAYEVTLENVTLEVDGAKCTNAQASGTGCPIKASHNVTAPKQEPTTLPATYTYRVVNPARSATTITNLDACEKTFTVVEKAPDPVTCSFTSVTSSASGSALGQSINISNPTVSCDGGGCKYSVKEGTTTIKSYTDYSDGFGFSFDGATEAGSHTYKVYMQRGSETEVECTGSYTVTYPLNLSCGSFTNPGATTPIAIGDAVTPASPTVPSSEYSGCNDKCSYAVTGGGSVSGGSGSNTDGTTVSSFTDASASGSGSSFTVDYTLTVSLKDGVTPLTCTLPVTYASGGGSGGGCHCADYCGSGCESNLKLTGSYTENPATSCFFFTSASNLNISGNHKINDAEQTSGLCSDGNPATCAAALSSIALADGGYYFKGHNGYAQLSITADYNPCATIATPTITACPVASATVALGKKVKVTPTTTNCGVLGGCNYTISATGTNDKSGTYYSGNISFDGETTPGTYNYTLSIRNSAGSAPTTCPFSVEYKNIEPTTIALNQTKSIKCGDDFKTNITCSNNCAKVSCSGSFDKKVTGSISGEKSAGQYNPVEFINGWANTATINETFSTECADDKSMSCSASCGC